jgi:hypothetical protein
MIFIERRICRLLDRRGKGSGARGAVTAYQSITQNLDDETTVGGVSLPLSAPLLAKSRFWVPQRAERFVSLAIRGQLHGITPFLM